MADESKRVVIFASINAISTLTAVATKIATTDNATVKNFYPTQAFIECVSSAGSIVTVAIASIGTNATSYNNIIPATAMAGLTTLGVHSPLRTTGAMYVVPPGTDIYFNIAAVPVGATAQTVNVYLEGFYR
jgi:hypothetical protein